MNAEIVVKKLKINYKDRQVFKDLLTSSIEEYITCKDGLLEQYLHSQLDILKTTFIREFNLDKEIKTNYGFAIHAKFNDLIKAIKETVNKDEKDYLKTVKQIITDWWNDVCRKYWKEYFTNPDDREKVLNRK